MEEVHILRWPRLAGKVARPPVLVHPQHPDQRRHQQRLVSLAAGGSAAHHDDEEEDEGEEIFDVNDVDDADCQFSM